MALITLAARCRDVWWQSGESYLHLRVAIRTQQHAFRRLATHRVEGARKAVRAQRKPLRGRVEMMEVERSRVPRITTENAAPTGLRDENLLHAPSPRRHARRAAPRTAVDALDVEHKP